MPGSQQILLSIFDHTHRVAHPIQLPSNQSLGAVDVHIEDAGRGGVREGGGARKGERREWGVDEVQSCSRHLAV